MIHEKTRRPTRCQLTARKLRYLNPVPLQSPTPTVAPVMHLMTKENFSS